MKVILSCYDAEVDSTTITLDVNSPASKEKAATGLAHLRRLQKDSREAGLDFTSTSPMAQFLRWAKEKGLFENGAVIRSLEMQWTRAKNVQIDIDIPLLEMFMQEAIAKGMDKQSPLIELYKIQVTRREESCARHEGTGAGRCEAGRRGTGTCQSLPSQELLNAFQEGGTGSTEMGRLGLVMRMHPFMHVPVRSSGNRNAVNITENGFILYLDPAVTVTTQLGIVDTEE
jgi:hypothetical protein